MDIRKIPIPMLMTGLPRDRRGYPVPFFQLIPPNFAKDGIVDFRVTDVLKKSQAIREKRCGICGQKLWAGAFALIGGPLSCDNRLFSDPAMHFPCARYAMKVCPYLLNDKYQQSEIPPDGAIVDPLNRPGRPEKMGLYIAMSYQSAKLQGQDDTLYVIGGPAKSIEWF